MTNEQYPFGVDIGSHLVLNKERPDQEMDFDILAAWELEPKFALIRAHRGRWVDPSYKIMRSESERVGLIVGTWHVLSPWEPTAPQVADWLNDVPDPGPLGRWIDWERVPKWGTTERRLPSSYQLRRSAEMIEDFDNRPAGIYARAQLINDFLGAISASQLNGWYWWLAQYLFGQRIRGEYPSERITVPRRVDRERLVIHQTADKLSPPKGCLPNVKGLDRDRWIGTMSMEDFCCYVQPPPLPTLEDRVINLEIEAREHGWKI